MRRYNRWAGNPRGTPEDETRCVVEVWCDKWFACQCSRKRGLGPDGLYCSQHARMLEAGRKVFVPKDMEEPTP